MQQRYPWWDRLVEGLMQALLAVIGYLATWVYRLGHITPEDDPPNPR